MADATPIGARISNLDPLWSRVREEAETAAANEPSLSAFIFRSISSVAKLEDAIVNRIVARLADPDMPVEILVRAFSEAIDNSPEIAQAMRADLSAVIDRDPACHRACEPVLYYKGFHAIQTARLAHWLWHKGRKDFALWLQSRSSSIFAVDIHPAAKLGRGLMLDHGTGLVVGETAVVQDNVSILHGVTLGGNGKDTGDRHPKVGHGVLIGAGAKILGNIEVGECARVAAGSVVLKDVPPCVTVAGVPAAIVGRAGCDQPSQSMDHHLSSPDFLGEGI